MRFSNHIRSNVVGYVALFFALTGAAYALERSEVKSKHIKDGQVKTADLATAAVSADKLADGAVTTQKLADLSVTTAKLAPGAVGSGQIADESLTNDDISESTLFNDDSLNTADINESTLFNNNTLDSNDVATDALTTSDIAEGGLSIAGDVTGTLGSAQITANAVGASEVTDDSLGPTDLAGVSHLGSSGLRVVTVVGSGVVALMTAGSSFDLLGRCADAGGNITAEVLVEGNDADWSFDANGSNADIDQIGLAANQRRSVVGVGPTASPHFRSGSFSAVSGSTAISGVAGAGTNVHGGECAWTVSLMG